MKIGYKLILTAVTAVAISMGLASCGKGEDVITAATTDNSLLAYVPADAPYLIGNLEPVPDAVVEANFRRAQPALDAVQSVLEGSRVNLSGSAAEENPEVAIFGAVLGELDGKLNREGLESLGLSMDGFQVVYGMGAFPVFRVSLKDAQALREAIGRIEASSGLNFAEQQHQGQAYWNLTANIEQGHQDVPMGIYLSIIEEADQAHMAFSLFPVAAETELLPAFLGMQKPAENTAARRLAEVSNDYGYTGYGAGFMDFGLMFDQFTEPTSLVHKLLVQNGMDPDEALDQVCQDEIRAMIARAPRAVAGLTELTPSTIGLQYRLEMADDLAGELAELVSSVPAAPAQSSRLLDFAFGIRVGAARDFLIRKATALSQEQFQCESLQGLNDAASRALVKLNTPMPPLVNNFLGLRASVSSMPEDESDFDSFRGTVALHVDKPEMFVGMAQMMLPPLAEFELEKNAAPQRLPESLIPMPGIEAYAAMSDTAIGVAVGQGEQAGLLDYLDSDSEGDGSFFSVNYDMAAYMEKLEELTQSFEDSGLVDDTDMNGDSEANAEAEARMREIGEAMRESFRAMAGRSRFDMRFDAHGLAMDTEMTFKE